MEAIKKDFEIKIEKNMPIPEKYTKSKYTSMFNNMDVGDSIRVNIKDGERIIATAYATRRKLKEKYISRKIAEKYVRIWRTK